VGGWLATDGLGVGSFEYGRLRENVLSASVVLPGGKLREVAGEEVGEFVSPGNANGIVVGARLRTRHADADRPFAASFAGPGAAEGILGAIAGLVASAAPLWHLAFLSPAMASTRGLGEGYLLFGAYDDERRGEEARAALERTLDASGGRMLGAAEALKVWGERFYPVAPSRPAPEVLREFVPLDGLPQALDARAGAAVQGTVACSGEVLLLALDGVRPGP
jgi:FAD/FMN-containing dehydrogenase